MLPRLEHPLLAQGLPCREGVSAPESIVSPADFERYVQALIDGDGATAAALVDAVLAADVAVPRLYECLMKPALYRVGDLWACNRISVACEQLATAITEGLLNRVYPTIVNPRRTGRKVVLATVEDELHQVGLRMAADIFEMRGWDTFLAEAGLGTDALLERVRGEAPDALALSFCVYFHLDRLDAMLARLRAELPNLPILLGGQGLAYGGRERVDGVPGLSCVDSLDELGRLLDAGFPGSPLLRESGR